MQLKYIYICRVEENHPLKIQDSLVPWLGKTMKMIDHHIEDILAENHVDLTKNQFVVLKNVEQNNGLSQQELAFFCNRNKSTLTRMVATLEKKKYIHKVHCQEDKRKYKIMVTPLGKEVVDQAVPHLIEFVMQIQHGVTEEETTIVKKVLNKIQDNMIGEGPSPFFKNKA